MPDALQWILLAAVGGAAAAVIGWPLLRGASTATQDAAGNPEAEARALRHRIALEGLLDVEADRRAGSLDEASYQRERAEAEERAAQTLGEEVELSASTAPAPGNARRAAALLGAALAVALLVGLALPAPNGLAERTVINQALADGLAREAERQAEIQRLLAGFAADPTDAEVLSDLADAYLAGDSTDDLQRAAAALQLLLAVDPEDGSAYRRLINAYLAASDLADAQAATDSYAQIASTDEPDIPFYLGLIAFREGDAAAAVRHFDRFLELAPDDGRAAMVSSLRAEAAGELPGSSAPPGG
ncbi:MAG: c-type cytochrome biogenesis protein CcmI [Chloroflexota bacterium]|nr:c-type cytochrome biogenesis protein CcmI [Chloroflexota bacterium]